MGNKKFTEAELLICTVLSITAYDEIVNWWKISTAKVTLHQKCIVTDMN